MSNVLTQISEAISGALVNAAPSIVRIEGARRTPLTGIAWSEDSVITASHAIRARDGFTIVRDDGTAFQATLVGEDAGTDVALLRATNAALRPMSWSKRDAHAGDIAIVAGRPGRSVRASIGFVSVAGGEWRTHHGSRIDRFIDVDASLPRGFSGGPLLDGDGACIGMNTSRVVPGGTTIPHATLARVVGELREHGSVRRPLIGIGVYPVEGGLLVMSVKAESSAERAGLLVGDIIRSIGGTDVGSPRALHSYLQDAAIGSEIEIAFTRGGESRTVKITVSS